MRRSRTGATGGGRGRGASAIEYLILIGLVAVVGLAGFRLAGRSADRKARAQAICVDSLACGSGSDARATTPELRTGAQAAKDEAADRGSKSVWARGADVAKGLVVDGLWGAITGLWQVVAHPVQTVEALGRVVAHPVDTGSALVAHLGQAWSDNPERVVGAAIFEIATLPVALTKATKAAKAGEVVELSKVERAVDRASDAAKAAQRVRAKSILAPGQSLREWIEKRAGETDVEWAQRTSHAEAAEWKRLGLGEETRNAIPWADVTNELLFTRAALDEARLGETLARELGADEALQAALVAERHLEVDQRVASTVDRVLSMPEHKAKRIPGYDGRDRLQRTLTRAARMAVEREPGSSVGVGALDDAMTQLADDAGRAATVRRTQGAARRAGPLDPVGAEASVTVGADGHVAVTLTDGTQSIFDGHVAASNGERYYYRTTRNPDGTTTVRYQSALDAAKTHERLELPVEWKHGEYSVVRGAKLAGDDDAYGLFFRPPPKWDHNGAMHRTETVGRTWYWPFERERVTDVPRPVADLRGMLVDAAGRPVVDMEKVAVWQAHGWPFGFQGISNKEASRLVAEEIARENARRPPWSRIEYVVLDSCMQGNRRFIGLGSNAQAFQGRLDAIVAATGQEPITVLASAKPGLLYGDGLLKVKGKFVPTTFIPASQQVPGATLVQRAVEGLFIVEGGALAYIAIERGVAELGKPRADEPLGSGTRAPSH